MTGSGVEDVDLLVVGGGKAGKSLAMDRAEAGWSVAMVERDKIGGTCINVACIPTKTLVGTARALLAVRHAGELGISVEGPGSVTAGSLRAHKEGVVEGMVDAHRGLFADSGMDFVLGTARFVADRTVEVETADGRTRRLRGRDVVVNTGTTPAAPPVAGIVDAAVWSSEDILRLEELPDSLVVLGGGYVGCELASVFAVLGTRVTLLQGSDQVLPREDPDMAGQVADQLRDLGVDVRVGARAEQVRREDDNAVVVTCIDGSEARADRLLHATGRRPVTDGLGLEATGVEVDGSGFVVVDAHLRTTAERVWAAGDVAGSPQFTHASWHDYRVLKDNLTGGDAETTGRVIPYTVFVTPELARIGLTETEARAAGHRVRVASIPAAAIPRSKTLRATTGSWKIVVDEDTELILGAALLGREAGEVLAAVQMAMLGGLTYRQVRDAPIAHPTMAEGLNLLLDAL